MGLLGPRTVHCPAGRVTAIFNHAFVQMPQSWTVTFTAADGGPVEGTVEERFTSWIFPNPPRHFALSAQMRFNRGWWNTFYKVLVKPTRDVTAVIG